MPKQRKIHKLHDGEIPSDVSELRGLINSNVPTELPGFLIQDHPNRPSKIITHIATGRTHTVGLFAAKEVIEALQAFIPH